VFRLVNELRDQSPTSLMHALADDGLTLSGHRRASDEPVKLGRVSDDPHDADEISDADLVNTAWAHVHEAWRDHPEHDRLVELQDEVDAEGRETWRLLCTRDDDGWIQYVFQPLDPRDPRPEIRIGAWPLQVFLDERKKGPRVVFMEQEHDDLT
jgi:hypothetical protein